jgi:hypothetical protein
VHAPGSGRPAGANRELVAALRQSVEFHFAQKDTEIRQGSCVADLSRAEPAAHELDGWAVLALALQQIDLFIDLEARHALYQLR